MAEALFKNLAFKDDNLAHFDISSAGTKDWDVGLRPDYRARQILAEHNIPLDPGKRAQKISPVEIHKADYLIAMTERIAEELGKGDNVQLLMDYVEDSKIKDIPDPYPTNTFVQAFETIQTGVHAFYDHLVHIVES